MLEQLKKYAKLFVNVGGNIQEGDMVIIGCDIGVAPFARLVQECAYDAGASEVVMNWHDDPSARAKYLRADSSVFETYPQWSVDKLAYQDEKKAVYLHILSSDPKLFEGVDQERLNKYNKISSEAIKVHRDKLMNSELRWSACAAASPEWARMVFPDLPEDEAVSRLWECILKAARAEGEDPISDWDAHKKNITKYADYLNEQQFKSLHITTGLGTDVTIGLFKDHIWIAGGGKSKDGISFVPNIPTEEVFTAPHVDEVDGTIVASMPLEYQGNIIENIHLIFEEGKVAKFGSRTNLKLLEDLIETDEGSQYLGEIALVPNSSPISGMNTLFYSTLFDENASSHAALGAAYPKNMFGGTLLSRETLLEMGLNNSLIHVDFMFGTADMNVTGIKADGTKVLFFQNGEFCFS